VAASGPVADQVQGRKVPFGSGLVGLAFDIAGTLQVRDASSDSRHDADFDKSTGFETRGSLCVPVLTSDGRAFGVIQLLNPPGASFDTEQVDVVETVARTLATALDAHLE